MARREIRVAYLSQGNVPSRWAHTMQAMKMAEALNRCVREFVFVTQANMLHRWLPRFDYESWYGIIDPFPIRELYAWRARWRRTTREVWVESFVTPAVDFARSFAPDLVITRYPKIGLRCMCAGLPTVVEVHMGPDDRGIADTVEGARHPLFRGVVTISEPLKRHYIGRGLPAEQILVFPDAVDPRLYERSGSRSEMRRSLRLAEHDFVAMYCGHLYEEKGVAQIIESARSHPDLHFAIVGGWSDDVRKRRREARGLRNVHFAGFVPNARVPSYLGAADVLLLPNRQDAEAAEWTSPMKLFEYLAAGRPIVASDLPVFRKHLSPRNAVLVEPGDSRALGQAIQRLRDDPRLREELSTRARQESLKWTWSKRAEAVLAFASAMPRT